VAAVYSASVVEGRFGLHLQQNAIYSHTSQDGVTFLVHIIAFAAFRLSKRESPTLYS